MPRATAWSAGLAASNLAFTWSQVNAGLGCAGLATCEKSGTGARKNSAAVSEADRIGKLCFIRSLCAVVCTTVTE